MYRIAQNDGYLLVELMDNFTLSVVQTIIHHETSMPQYPDTNDIWLIGSHRADIHLGDIELMVNEFQCRCPRQASRTKTAIVVDEGLTGAILELWVKGLQRRVAFDIRIFRTLDQAQAWQGVVAADVV